MFLSLTRFYDVITSPREALKVRASRRAVDANVRAGGTIKFKCLRVMALDLLFPSPSPPQDGCVMGRRSLLSIVEYLTRVVRGRKKVLIESDWRFIRSENSLKNNENDTIGSIVEVSIKETFCRLKDRFGFVIATGCKKP